MIKIYGKPACPWCVKAKKLADRHGLKYEYIDIQYKEGFDELAAKMAEIKTVPQIWWYDNYIGGYEEFATEIENTSGGYGDGKI